MAYSMAVKIPNFRPSLIPTNMRELERSDRPADEEIGNQDADGNHAVFMV